MTQKYQQIIAGNLCCTTVRMAERSKALRSGRSPVFRAWVRIPLLTNFFFVFILFFQFDSYWKKKLIPLGFEPRTSRVWGERDNHYTMESNNASAGNRTRAARVAGEHSTTEPPMLDFLRSIISIRTTALYWLSLIYWYHPQVNSKTMKKFSSLGGLEPPTFRLTAERANRLRHRDLG